MANPIASSRRFVGHSWKGWLAERFGGRARMILRCLTSGHDQYRQLTLRLGEETFDCERCPRCDTLHYNGIQRR